MTHLTFDLDGLTIDTIALASQGNAVLGIRDSGKTVTAEGFAERFFAARIPFVAFDPIGVWRFLRVPGVGDGIPVVVAGGQAGDLPLAPETASEIVRSAMKAGVSLVVDLYDINLSKAQWKRIVGDSVRVLLHENGQYGLRHVFIEEASEFAPQRVGPDSAVVYAEIEKLARMGGNARLGYTLINQRPEEVAKAVLELCDNLFLHRQKGRHSISALTKWLDVGAVKDAREITDTLSTLPTGQCWAWMQGSETPRLVRVPMKQSFHPDRRAMMGEVQLPADPVPADRFVAQVRAMLAAREAPKVDPTAGVFTSAQVEVLNRKAFGDGKEEGLREGLASGIETGRAELREEVIKALGLPGAAKFFAPHEKVSGVVDLGNGREVVEIEVSAEEARAIRDPGPSVSMSATVKPAPTLQTNKAASELLRAARAVHPVKLTWGQLCVMTQRKAEGGSFNVARRLLLDGAYLAEENSLVSVAKAGLEAFEGPPPRRTRPLADLFAEKLPSVSAELFGVIRGEPHGISIADLAARTGRVPAGGSWNVAISTLRRNGLVSEANGLLLISPAITGRG